MTKFIYHVAAKLDVRSFDGILHRDKPILGYEDLLEVKTGIHKEMGVVPEVPAKSIAITSLTFLHTVEVEERKNGEGPDKEADNGAGGKEVDPSATGGAD